MNNYNKDYKDEIMEVVSKGFSKVGESLNHLDQKIEEVAAENQVINAVLSNKPIWETREERNAMITKENECKQTTGRSQDEIAKRYSTADRPLKQPDVSKIARGEKTSK